MDRVQFTGPSGRGLLPLAAAVALTLTSANTAVGQEVTDRLLNDYRQPAGAGPGIPWSATHGTSFSDDIMWMTHTKGPLKKRWHDGLREDGPLGGGGLLTPFPAYVSPDGIHMWGVSARGLGTPHVHVWNRYTGERVWESAPWPGSAFADPEAGQVGPSVVTSFVTTDAEGNVYWADDKAVYSYRINEAGEVEQRWVTPYPRVYGNGSSDADDSGMVQLDQFPIGQALITEQRVDDDGNSYALVGGASLQGFWTWVRSDTGDFVVAEPVNVMTQDGGVEGEFPSEVECSAPLRALFSLVGLSTPELAVSVAQNLLCAAFGRGTPTSESTSYEPETGLVYQYFGVEGLEDDELLGGEDRVITAHRITDTPRPPQSDEDIGTAFSMAQEWSSPRFQGGGATTPTVCSDTVKLIDGVAVPIDGQVIVADGNAKFQSVSNKDGGSLWTSSGEGEAALSPAVDKNCNLVAANRRELLKFERGTGLEIRGENYDFLASLPAVELPVLEPDLPLVPDGAPKSNLLSVQVTGPDENITTLSFGYNVRVPNCFEDDPNCRVPIDYDELYETAPELANALKVVFGSEQYSSWKSGYLLTDADTLLSTGDVSVIDFEGGSVDTAQAPSVDGWVVGAITDVFGMIYENTTERLVADRFKSPGPRFGYYALETEDHPGNAVKRLKAIQMWNAEVVSNLDAGDPDLNQYAFDVARRGVPALKPVAIPEELRRAEELGDICAREANEASGIIAEALQSQVAAKEGLLGNVSNTQVKADLASANALIGEAIAVIQRDVNNCRDNGNGNGPPGGQGPGNPLPPGLGGNPPPGQGGPNPGKGKGKA